MLLKMEIENLVIQLSNNFCKIIDRNDLRNHKKLNWGDNGIGDRWCNKKFNYTLIYHNGNLKKYSENDNDIVNNELLQHFLDENKKNKNKGIIGIFVHSIRTNIDTRPIREDIKKEIRNNSCVSCGSNSSIVCDHKNDLYNDSRVLNNNTQIIDDFQPLCNHCNLQKREISNKEKKENKIYSAKNIAQYKVFYFDFPWEKKVFDINDISTKNDTYWYDPVEFNRKIYIYMLYVIPIVKEIKKRNINKSMKSLDLLLNTLSF